MHTYEMVGIADENGKTYESKYGTYNKKDGFRKYANIFVSNDELLNIMFHEDCWTIKQEEELMTLDEIIKEVEKSRGHKIKIKDDKPRLDQLSRSLQYNKQNDVINLLKKYFN